MLVAFDFDGALAETDMTVALAAERGEADEAAAIADRAAAGEIDHAESIRQRGALLEGLPRDRVERAFDRIHLRPGARGLLADLRGREARTSVISGAFERGIQHAFGDADEAVTVDDVVANRLVFDEHDALTGEVQGPLLDRGKDEALEEVATAAGVDLAETIAVGDAETDLPMLQAAEHAVGFQPDPVVEPHVDVVVPDVDRLRLYFEEHGVL